MLKLQIEMTLNYIAWALAIQSTCEALKDLNDIGGHLMKVDGRVKEAKSLQLIIRELLNLSR